MWPKGNWNVTHGILQFYLVEICRNGSGFEEAYYYETDVQTDVREVVKMYFLSSNSNSGYRWEKWQTSAKLLTFDQVSLFLCLFVSLFVCLFLCLFFVCFFVSLFVSLFLCFFVSLFVCLLACLFVCFVSLLVCLFVCLYVCLFVSFVCNVCNQSNECNVCNVCLFFMLCNVM